MQLWELISLLQIFVYVCNLRHFTYIPPPPLNNKRIKNVRLSQIFRVALSIYAHLSVTLGGMRGFNKGNIRDNKFAQNCFGFAYA